MAGARAAGASLGHCAGPAPANGNRSTGGPRRSGTRPDVAELTGQAEEPQAEAEEQVIIDHGAGPPAHRLKHDKHGVDGAACYLLEVK